MAPEDSYCRVIIKFLLEFLSIVATSLLVLALVRLDKGWAPEFLKMSAFLFFLCITCYIGLWLESKQKTF